MGPADRFDTRFGKSEMKHFPLLNQLLDGAGDLFDRHGRIDAVLIKQINHLDLEPLERTFHRFADVRRVAVERRRGLGGAWVGSGGDIETELRGDDDLLAQGSERFTQQFFIVEGTVDFGRVEKVNAPLDGGMEQCRHFLLVLGRTVGKAHPHAAKPEGRNF